MPVGTILQRTLTLGVVVDAACDLQGVVALIASSLLRRTPLLMTFVNPSSRSVAQAQSQFCNQLERFDAVLPDGIGMSVAVRWLHRLPATRISFDMTSLAPEVMALADRGACDVVLVGGVPGCAERAASRLTEVFPKLRIAGAFDGYGDVESRATQIAALNPHIVVCGMGAGVQEAMLLALARTGWNGCGFTCGGYLDQLAEGPRYYPQWIDRTHLRWAYRLAREPRRLWRRYLLSYPPFFAALGLEVLYGLIFGSRGTARRPMYGTRHSSLTQPTVEDAPVEGGR